MRLTTEQQQRFERQIALPATSAVPQGPLGVVPGVIGTIQAAEAIKHLLNLGTPLTDRLLTFDILSMNVRCVRVKRSRDCPLCGRA